MQHPVVLLNNPIEIDYSELLINVVSLIKGCNQLDILILHQINDASNLNEVLYKYYTLVRTEVQASSWFDHSFQINIIFNISDDKIRKLAQNWNRAIFAQAEMNVIKAPKSQITALDVNLEHSKFSPPSKTEKKSIGQFKTTAVGGTFDHLHDGHKILLSMASFLTKLRMIIGITGSELLKNKKFGDALESFSKRQQSVTTFLHMIMGDDHYYEVYEINDVCGPTGYIEDIDGLVISLETASGGDFVNKYRREQGYKQLDITAIKVIGQSETNNAENSWKGKISSTDIRAQELEKTKSLEQFSR